MRFWNIHVLNPADLPEKEHQVTSFRESSELPGIVEPNIHDTLDIGLSKKGKESFGGLLRKADRKDFHAA